MTLEEQMGWLVVGIPIPLKKIRVRQLGLPCGNSRQLLEMAVIVSFPVKHDDSSQNMEQIRHVPTHQPELGTGFTCVRMPER